MTREPQQRAGFWSAATLTGLAAAAGYCVYLLCQPACGAPGNTTLGQSNRYVPWVLLVAEIITVAAFGKLLQRRTSTIIRGVLVASALAAAAGCIVFAFWFGSGDCGE